MTVASLQWTLSANQRQVVDSLAVYGGKDRVWARPMDIGGRDGSHHTGTLRGLMTKKIVERALRDTLMNFLGPGRGSYLYRLTDNGWQIAQALRTTLYPADSSWHPFGNRGGRRYHRAADADAGLASCSSRIVLNDDAAITIAELQRQGQSILICRKCVPEKRA